MFSSSKELLAKEHQFFAGDDMMPDFNLVLNIQLWVWIL